MKIKFDVTHKELNIIQDIFAKYLCDDCKVWVFGSRAKNTALFNSDLDLAIECKDKIDLNKLNKIKSDLEFSRLPYTVDLIDINAIKPHFKDLIQSEMIAFPLNKNSNMPKLRFSGYSRNWSNEKLKEITSYVDYRGRAPIKTEEGCFLVTAKNIKRGYIDYECSQEYVAVDNYTNVMSKGLPLIGDVLFTTEAPMGHVAQVDRTNIALAQRVIKFRATSLLTNDYLFHYMLSETYQCLVTKKSYGTTVQGISGKELHQTILSFPTLPEQQKIASFLTSIDKKIELLTQKEKLLKDYKKGIMQKIFSQEIRFKADDGSDFPEWVEKRLGDVSKITTGKLDANAMVDGGKYRFYTCAKDYFRINDYAFETNALIISGNGANVGYIHHYDGRFNAYQRTYVLDGFIDNIIFVKYTLDKNLSKRIMQEKNEGNTPYIVMGTLANMSVNLPSVEEQTKIANFLSVIDHKIEQVTKQLNHTKEFKKALLQQMFV